MGVEDTRDWAHTTREALLNRPAAATNHNSKHHRHKTCKQACPVLLTLLQACPAALMTASCTTAAWLGC